MMTDTTTPILLATAERAIRNMSVPRYRTEARADLLTVRNQIRSRTAELVERLEKGDAWCDANADNPSVVKGESRYIELLHDYCRAYDGLQLCEANL